MNAIQLRSVYDNTDNVIIMTDSLEMVLDLDVCRRNALCLKAVKYD